MVLPAGPALTKDDPHWLRHNLELLRPKYQPQQQFWGGRCHLQLLFATNYGLNVFIFPSVFQIIASLEQCLHKVLSVTECGINPVGLWLTRHITQTEVSFFSYPN